MHDFNRMKISRQIMLFASVVMLICTLVFLYSYWSISSSLIQNNINYTTQTLSQFHKNIDERLTRIENILKNTGFDKDVVDYLYEAEPGRRLELFSSIHSKAIRASEIEPSVISFIVQGENGRSFYMGGKSTDAVQVMSNIPARPDNDYYLIDNSTLRNAPNTVILKNSFIIATSLYDIWHSRSDDYSGVIAFAVKNSYFGVQDYRDSTNTALYLLDQDYNIFLSNKYTSVPDADALDIIERLRRSEIGQAVEYQVDRKFYLVNYEPMDPFGGLILSITPKQDIVNEINWIRTRMFGLLALAILLILAVFVYFRHQITMPLFRFLDYIRKLRRRNMQRYDEPLALEGFQEIEDIASEFNNMTRELRALTRHLMQTTAVLYETELQSKQSELNYMRSQINPHFLHNTLEVIVGLSLSENAPKSAEMMLCLARIFKYSIKGSDLVTVRDELAITQSYIHILQTRFEDMFSVIYEFDEDALDCPMPKMILQPLTENAFSHGIETKGEGTLCIGAARAAPDTLHLWVWDDGAGMDTPTRMHLQRLIDGDVLRQTESMGFANVVSRIRLLYGDRVRIRLTSSPGAGTRIDLTIPIAPGGDDKHV